MRNFVVLKFGMGSVKMDDSMATPYIILENWGRPTLILSRTLLVVEQ